MSAGAWLLDLLFPPRCPWCGRVTDGGACSKCAAALPRTEGQEAEQLLPGALRCASPLWYEDAAREGILRFKFHGAEGAAEEFGALLAACAAERFSGEFDTVTWVPVGPRRLRRRGYDQARLLAESACRPWGIQPVSLLKKPRDNPAQSGLGDAAARRANVLGMYEPAGDAAGRRVLLVDDIVTTGATICECARVLRDAGAAAVLGLTLARTRPERPTRTGTASGSFVANA